MKPRLYVLLKDLLAEGPLQVLYPWDLIHLHFALLVQSPQTKGVILVELWKNHEKVLIYGLN